MERTTTLHPGWTLIIGRLNRKFRYDKEELDDLSQLAIQRLVQVTPSQEIEEKTTRNRMCGPDKTSVASTPAWMRHQPTERMFSRIEAVRKPYCGGIMQFQRIATLYQRARFAMREVQSQSDTNRVL